MLRGTTSENDECAKDMIGCPEVILQVAKRTFYHKRLKEVVGIAGCSEVWYNLNAVHNCRVLKIMELQ